MATGSISKADGWRRYETQGITITVLDAAGAAHSVAGHSLRFVVSRQHGAAAIVTKSTPTITIGGAGSNVVTIPFVDADYALLTADVYAGLLWDDTDDTPLWPRAEDTGDMYLGHGLAAP